MFPAQKVLLYFIWYLQNCPYKLSFCNLVIQIYWATPRHRIVTGISHIVQAGQSLQVDATMDTTSTGTPQATKKHLFKAIVNFYKFNCDTPIDRQKSHIYVSHNEDFVQFKKSVDSYLGLKQQAQEYKLGSFKIKV